MPPSTSALAADRRGFWAAALEITGSGLVSSVTELNHYVNCTLLVHTCASHEVR